jgi:hypothetical protein
LWIGNPTTPPPPLVSAVHQDREGLIWVFVKTASPDWREAWAAVPSGAREIPVRAVRHEKLHKTTVEVLDPRSGRVVARSELPDWVISTMAGDLAAAYIVGEDDIPRIRLLRFALHR